MGKHHELLRLCLDAIVFSDLCNIINHTELRLHFRSLSQLDTYQHLVLCVQLNQFSFYCSSLIEWAVFAVFFALFFAYEGVVDVHPADRLDEIVEQVKTLQIFLVGCQRAMRFVVLEVAITPRYVSHTELHWFVSCATFK